MTPRVVKVEPLSNYELMLEFDNGERKKYDVNPLIKGSWMGQLRDLDLFNTVHVGGISVEWDGGQDLCPDDLYENSVPLK